MMNHPKMKYTYVGVDSHKGTHTAVFLDCFYGKLGEITFENLPAKFSDFLVKADNFKIEGTTLLFGLEDVSAYGRALTIFLTDNSQQVKHVNALLVSRERKNRNVTEKTDSVDAECAARVLLNKLDELPDAEPQDNYHALRMLVVRRESLVKNNISLKNNLHTLITSHYPSYQEFFANIDSNTALTFFKNYPSPSTLQNTTVEELTNELHKLSNGRVNSAKVSEIWEHIKTDGNTETEYQDVYNFSVQIGRASCRERV